MAISIDEIYKLDKQRKAAIELLANWIASIELHGSDWDSWDHHYKNARRNAVIGSLLNKRVNEIKKAWKDDWGDE